MRSRGRFPSSWPAGRLLASPQPVNVAGAPAGVGFVSPAATSSTGSTPTTGRSSSMTPTSYAPPALPW
jgi:hypothetical protein